MGYPRLAQSFPELFGIYLLEELVAILAIFGTAVVDMTCTPYLRYLSCNLLIRFN